MAVGFTFISLDTPYFKVGRVFLAYSLSSADLPRLNHRKQEINRRLSFKQKLRRVDFGPLRSELVPHLPRRMPQTYVRLFRVYSLSADP